MRESQSVEREAGRDREGERERLNMSSIALNACNNEGWVKQKPWSLELTLGFPQRCQQSSGLSHCYCLPAQVLAGKRKGQRNENLNPGTPTGDAI